MAGDTAAVMVSGFVYLVASQVATRLITFTLTLLSARLLTVEGYGMASVQFHLINTIILLLSREGFRRGCMRMPEGENGTKRILATVALCWPLGLLVTSAVCLFSLSRYGQLQLQAVMLQGLAAMLELAAEPLYILAQTQLRFKLRVAVEAAANIVKAALILLLLKLRLLGEVQTLCLAQVAFAAAVLLGYVLAYAQQGLVWLTSRSQGQPRATTAELKKQRAAHVQEPLGQHELLDWQALRLSWSFTIQAAEKLVLAEGSKVVMVLCQSTYNQGVYGLVVNLGSLVVRTLFQPFEEAAFLAFGRQDADRAAVQSRTQMLSTMVKGAALIGMLAAAFGPAYSYVALRLAYGRRWSETEAPSTLALYSPYICLLAINGILEAFQHAVATPSQLSHSNAWLVGFSVTQVALSVGLMDSLGAKGLIWADAGNIALRIGYSMWFVGNYNVQLKGQGVRMLMLGNKALSAYAAAFIITSISNYVWLGGPGQLIDGCGIGCPIKDFWLYAAAHIGIGGVMLGVLGLTVWQTERQLWSSLKSMRQKQE